MGPVEELGPDNNSSAVAKFVDFECGKLSTMVLNFRNPL
jgi:hypothetical protein